MPVLPKHKHIYPLKGDDQMPTRTIQQGGVTVNIFEPEAVTDEERERVEKDFSAAVWAIYEELIERGEEV